jgi:hypothetical protein
MEERATLPLLKRRHDLTVLVARANPGTNVLDEHFLTRHNVSVDLRSKRAQRLTVASYRVIPRNGRIAVRVSSLTRAITTSQDRVEPGVTEIKPDVLYDTDGARFAALICDTSETKVGIVRVVRLPVCGISGCRGTTDNGHLGYSVSMSFTQPLSRVCKRQPCGNDERQESPGATEHT